MPKNMVDFFKNKVAIIGNDLFSILNCTFPVLQLLWEKLVYLSCYYKENVKFVPL
jgi:hypothetical protein